MSKIILTKKAPSEGSQKTSEVDITKATYNDKIRWIHEAVDDIEYYYKDRWGEHCRCYIWLKDHDDNFLYVYIKDATYRMPYTMKGNSVEIDISNPVEVACETIYTEIAESEDDTMVEKILKGIEKYFGGSSKETPKEEDLRIVKQLQEDEMVAIEPLYINAHEPDGHSDTMDEVEIRKMVVNLNKAIDEKRIKSSLFHQTDENGKLIVSEGFEIVKAWVNEVDSIIGESFVPEGQPIVKTQFKDKKLWEARKSGKLKGVSIGAKAKRVEEREV